MGCGTLSIFIFETIDRSIANWRKREGKTTPHPANRGEIRLP